MSIDTETMRLFLDTIELVKKHPWTPEMQDIVDDIERDIDMKYSLEEITMQQRLILRKALGI